MTNRPRARARRGAPPDGAWILRLAEKYAGAVRSVDDERGEGVGEGVWFHLRRGRCTESGAHSVHLFRGEGEAEGDRALADLYACDCEACAGP